MFFLAQSIGFEPTSLLSQRFSRPLPHHPDTLHILVGRVGVEPTQPMATVLQTAPALRLRRLPI